MIYSKEDNPWKGLNFYVEGEIIYGRDTEIVNLSHYIFNNTQTIFYGRSGIGKSSILNAGIFPEARRQGKVPVTIRLKHDNNEPYLNQIVCSLKESGITLIEKVNALNSNSETLWEFMHRHEFVLTKSGEGVIPLIVLDQFEEIFTLQQDESVRKAFFNELADLLNNVKPLYIVNDESERRLSTTNKPTISIESGNFKGVSISLNLPEENTEKEFCKNYIDNPLFHIVFAIREDFLSSLEIYSHNIPAMKNNRFPLLPLTGKQALDIITKPIPNLFEQEVAYLIIEKVTGKKISDENIQDVEVDSAILSLYLNRLFDKMLFHNRDTINNDLVENYSSNIIEDYYIESIKGIPSKSVEWLEDTLINSQGRRDNRDRSTVINEAKLSDGELDELINKTKLLHQFSFGGSFRIEYIHDVLTPIIVKHRNERVVLKRQRKIKRRNIILSILFVVLGIALISYLIPKSQQTNYMLNVKEDKTINLSEYWQANLIVSFHGDTIVKTMIDKSNLSTAFIYKSLGSRLPKIDIDFTVGNLKIDTTYYRPNNNNNNNNQISVILTQKDKRRLVQGRVMSNVGSKAPISDALVIIDDQVAKTNNKGEFRLYIDDEYSDNIIRIIRNGYKFYEGNIAPKGIYRLQYNRNFNFYNEAGAIEKKVSNGHNRYSLTGPIYNIENGDTLSGLTKVELSIEKDSIFGYLYYNNVYEKEKNKYNSYFLIYGTFNAKNKTFKLKMEDAVNNCVNYQGSIKGNNWVGESYNKNIKVSYFDFK